MGENSQKPILKREFSAGGVVFKKKGNDNLWLVTKSKPSELFPKGFWRLPKGWLDNKSEEIPGPLASGERKAKEDDLKDAAIREVSEEGGVKAKILQKLGTERYFLTIRSERILKFVTFYLMEWQSDLPEGPGWETETIEWLSYDDAYGRITYRGEKQVLKKARELLKRGTQGSLI